MPARPRSIAFVVAALVTAAVTSCGGDGDGPQQRATGERAGDEQRSGLLVIDDLDERDASYVEGSRTYLQVEGSDHWGELRTQDGTVRLELAAGSHRVTAWQYVCSAACPDADRIRRMADADRPSSALTSCSTTVELDAGAEIWMRAQLGVPDGTCSWKQQPARDTLEPPGRRTPPPGGGPPPTWIESSHGSVWMQPSSYCWSFPGGGGCADGAAGSCAGPPDAAAFNVAPELDARPGELVTVHVGPTPTRSTVTLRSTVPSRDEVMLGPSSSRDRRTLRFAAPDDDATVGLSIRAGRGDASWFACIRAVGRAADDDEPTVVTTPTKHAITTEEQARRQFDIEHRGGGLAPIPGTIRCDAEVRTDLADAPAWRCSAYLGDVRQGKVLEASGFVLRDDGGIVLRDQRTLDAPDELLQQAATDQAGGAAWRALLDGSEGSVEMEPGPVCRDGRCTKVSAPAPCDAPGSPPHLRVVEGTTFSARLPFIPTGAALYLDETNVRDTTRHAAQRHADGRLLTTTLLLPRRTFVTAFAWGPRGEATWYACIDPVPAD